jgi:hypothetical protein
LTIKHKLTFHIIKIKMWGSKKKAPVKPAPTKKAAAKKSGAKKTSKPAGNKTDTSKEETKGHDIETIFKVYATDTEMGKSIIGGEGITILASDWGFDLASSCELLVFMWNCS